jgi:hypothetical protein
LLDFLLLPSLASAQDGRPGAVTTQGGIRYSGKITLRGRVAKVTSPLTDVYLSAAAVRRTRSGGDDAAVPIYRFNEHVHKRPKKGKIQLVVKNARHRVAADGIDHVTLDDPVLGTVSFTAPLTKMTPHFLHWSGLEYAHEYSFPLAHNPQLIRLAMSVSARQRVTRPKRRRTLR